MGWVTGWTLFRFLGKQLRRTGRRLRPSHWFPSRKKRGKRVKSSIAAPINPPIRVRVNRYPWYLRPFTFIGHTLIRLLRKLNPLALLPFLFKLGRRLVIHIYHASLVRFFGHRLGRILTSLWFRLMAAFTAVILIMLFIVSGVISTVTEREFDQYIQERNNYIRAIIPTLVADQDVTDRERPLPDFPEPPEFPKRSEETDNPKSSTLPEAVEVVVPQPPSIVNPEVIINEVVEPIVIEEVVVQVPSFEKILVPDSLEEQGFQFLRDMQEATETAVIAGGIVSLVLGTLLFWQITRPLAKIRHATQLLAQGQTGVRVPIRRQDEMGKVAMAFNQMATQIEQQEQGRKQMVADVAHELRTPLTVMKSNLEAMMDGLIQPTDAELGELHDEVERMSRMIDDLRLLSLADAGQLTLSRSKVDLRHLIDLVIARHTLLAEERGVQLLTELSFAPLLAHADSDRLQQALGNLVDNAIRHSLVGGVVRVTAVQDSQFTHISINDGGPGISEADIPHLFDRFWRGDKSRTRNSGGSGLGLSIVKQIVEMHNGHIQVVSLNGSGATFTLSLPLARP
jgi:signal transduction histidine kinase